MNPPGFSSASLPGDSSFCPARDFWLCAGVRFFRREMRGPLAVLRENVWWSLENQVLVLFVTPAPGAALWAWTRPTLTLATLTPPSTASAPLHTSPPSARSPPPATSAQVASYPNPVSPGRGDGLGAAFVHGECRGATRLAMTAKGTVAGPGGCVLIKPHRQTKYRLISKAP